MAQRMEEASVANPPLLLDQLVMHDCNVSGCPAEADPSQLAPEAQRYLKGRSRRRIVHPAAFQIPRGRRRRKTSHEFCNLHYIITS